MEVFQPHNTKRNTNQHWNNFVKWWEARKQSIVSENILDGDVFPDVSLAELLQDIQTVMLSAAHLQRGHILALYVTELKPKIKNLTHLDGGSIKNYVDGICRKLKECESKSTELAERYGSWSVWTHHHYSKLHEKTAIKVYQEDKENRGKKVTEPKTSEPITAATFQLLIQRTLEQAETHKSHGNLHLFVLKQAEAAVLIIVFFCGCRAQQETADIIFQDFTVFQRNLIRFKQSSTTKTRKLNKSFKFKERYPAWILGEYCEPIHFFLEKRPAHACDRFFLYEQPSATFSSSVLLAANKPIGLGPLGASVKKNAAFLIKEGLLMPGTYSNTSLRKGLMDRLGIAGVPPLLADMAIGHFQSKDGDVLKGLSSIPNAGFYINLMKSSVTQKKLALLLYDLTLKWDDVYDEDNFNNIFRQICPEQINCSETPSVLVQPSSIPHTSPAPPQQGPKRSALLEQLLMEFGSSDESDLESPPKKQVRTANTNVQAEDIEKDSDPLDNFDFWDDNELITTNIDPVLSVHKTVQSPTLPIPSKVIDFDDDEWWVQNLAFFDHPSMQPVMQQIVPPTYQMQQQNHSNPVFNITGGVVHIHFNHAS